jgi:hypothetical protein
VKRDVKTEEEKIRKKKTTKKYERRKVKKLARVDLSVFLCDVISLLYSLVIVSDAAVLTGAQLS